MGFLIRNLTKNRINLAYLNFIAKKTFSKCGISEPFEASLIIVGDGRIKSLNRQYGKKDKITDVLSFGSQKKNKNKMFIMPDLNVSDFGDIFISYPQAKRQSKRKGHSIKKELSVLLVHGILHLLGYDHIKDCDARNMRRLEQDILKSL